VDEAFLLQRVMGSVLGGRSRKRGKKALRYLTGRHSSIWSNPATLLTAAGVAWGVYETLTTKDGEAANAGSPAASTGAAGPRQDVSVPPLPAMPGAAPPGVSADALRLVRLAVSAANADGVMNDQERAAVIREAQTAGVGEIVAAELQQQRPLAEIVAGVADTAQCATLYVLAFTILRADEQLTGAERIYLAQLAHLLGLDRDTIEKLEKDTGERIDALGDQGQLGG
jgi:uncharacterized membrane protein YebE (DUF533 family)